MVKKNRVIIFLSISLFLALSHSSLAEANDVVINEIAWMGTGISANDEWTVPQNNLLG